jgi:hypothetical protein
VKRIAARGCRALRARALTRSSISTSSWRVCGKSPSSGFAPHGGQFDRRLLRPGGRFDLLLLQLLQRQQQPAQVLLDRGRATPRSRRPTRDHAHDPLPKPHGAHAVSCRS